MAYYDLAVGLGIFLGMIFVLGIVMFIDKVEAYKFRQYLLERDDKTREDIKKELDKVSEAYKVIADTTNTMTFKRRANSIHDFISFIKKYRTN